MAVSDNKVWGDYTGESAACVNIVSAAQCWVGHDVACFSTCYSYLLL